jgi:opacity protein-like surface antigen
MKKMYALLALVLASAAAASPASAAPAQHFEDSVVGDVFVCASAEYTVTEGTLMSVFHEGSSKSGNTNFTGTLVPRHVVLEDEDGNQYSLAGAVWFGDTANAQQGTAQGTFTAHMNIVRRGGGVVDTVRQTGHFSSTGEFFLDNGSCELPE